MQLKWLWLFHNHSGSEIPKRPLNGQWTTLDWIIACCWCKDGYYLNGNECKSWTGIKTCKTCSNGYFSRSGDCTKCHIRCALCLDSTSKNGSRCNNDFYLIGNERKSFTGISICTKFSTNECTECVFLILC